jgi:hypothetical protein
METVIMMVGMFAATSSSTEKAGTTEYVILSSAAGYSIYYRCEDSRFLISAACRVTISNPKSLFPSDERG